MTATRNQFAQACWRCGKIVPKGEGTVTGKPGDWQISHVSCIPEYKRVPGLEYDL